MAGHNVDRKKAQRNLNKRIEGWQKTITMPSSTTPKPNDKNFTKPGSHKKS
jgi:hypothetical protein